MEECEKIIRSVVRYISRLNKFDDPKQKQRDLHILGAKDRAKFKVMLLTWKVLHFNEPKILVDCVPVRKVNVALRSSEDSFLVGRLEKFENTTTKGRFAYSSHLFNDLPKHIRSITDIDRFKRQLKAYLFPPP